MNEDLEQLRQFSNAGSQDAFAAVVKRYLRLVYGAALRRVNGDVHQAEDVTQMVFMALARNASALSKHPDLPGWLFTTTRYLAAKTLRRDHRRELRENAIAALPTMNDEPSAPLHSILDDVIAELRQLDRQIILLRFHGGLPMSEIGSRLGITENAVQKRIARALDALKENLARRGVTSTAAAIAVAVEQQGVVAMPAGLTAAAISTGGMGGAAAFGVSALVGLSKTQLGIAAVVVFAGTAGLVWQTRENAQLKRQLVERTTAANARPEELKKQLASIQERVGAAEADAAKLQAALQSAQSAQSTPPSARVLTDSRAQTKAALGRASTLMREGKFQDALDEYLRTYRELAGKRGAASIDRQLIMSAVKRLGDTYPPALPALRGLRDEALQRFLANRDDNEIVSEIGLLNERLGEGRSSISLYDTLPSGHAGRQALANIAHNSFVEAQRYADALVGKSFGSMLNEFDMALRSPRDAAQRSYIVKSTVTNIEALSGAGKADEARTLIQKLLAFDNTDDTRAEIREHVQRANLRPSP